jgi:hypothetical protein
MNKIRILLFCVLALALTISCSLGGLSDQQMQATSIALQATQVALEMKILELQQQQTAAAQPLPTAEPEAQAHAAIPGGNEVLFEGIHFYYDATMATSVEASIVPSTEDIVGVIPEHIEFVFGSYAWTGSMHTPTIYIYPVDAYRSANEYVNENIDGLKTLLDQRPAAPDTIPFLPMWNAGQMFNSNVEYLDFENGSGVRFLTQYGQAIYPINNNGLFYTFQGLTNDGAWYVAMVLPVANPLLSPDGNEPPGGDWETFDANFEAHLAEVKTLLQSQPNPNFTPNLNLLDDMVRSMRVK